MASDAATLVPAFASSHTGGFCNNQPAFSADPQNAPYPYALRVLNQKLAPPAPDAPVERLENGGFIAYVALNCRPPVIKFELLTKDGDPIYYETLIPGTPQTAIAVTVAGDDEVYYAKSHGHSSVNDAEIDAAIFGIQQDTPYHSHGVAKAFSHRWVVTPDSAALLGGSIIHLDPYGKYTVRVTFYTRTVGSEGDSLGYVVVPVGAYVDNSIWNRILRNLNPLLWAFRLNMALSEGATRVICIPLKFVGVHSANCVADANEHAARSPLFPSAIDVEIAGLRSPTPMDANKKSGRCSSISGRWAIPCRLLRTVSEERSITTSSTWLRRASRT